jgi:uncharacterized Ntn-hydrolase superfamily protein
VKRGLVAAMFGVALAPSTARATYSIVAADTTSKESGGAGTSCLQGVDDVHIIFGVAPGRGALVAQALWNQQARDEGTLLLADGAEPSLVLARITAPDFDADASVRQYGIVDVTGRTAAFTGSETSAFARDRRGVAGSLAYSAQGNFLTSEQVVERASDAFEASGCDLAERMLLALEAGAEGGEGDRRCTATGIPSDSAFLAVYDAGPTDPPLVELRVPGSGAENPLLELRAQYEAWRQEHPCPTPHAPGPDADAANSAQNGTDAAGCGCVLPRGRTADGLLPAALAVAVWLGRRRAARSVRGIPSALPRE